MRQTALPCGTTAAPTGQRNRQTRFNDRAGGEGWGGGPDPRSASGGTRAGLRRRAVNPRVTLHGNAGLRRAPNRPRRRRPEAPSAGRCHGLGPGVTLRGAAIPTPSPRVRGAAVRAAAVAPAPPLHPTPRAGAGLS